MSVTDKAKKLLTCIFPVGAGDAPRRADEYIAACFLSAARADALEEAARELQRSLDGSVGVFFGTPERRGVEFAIEKLRELKRRTACTT